MARNSGYKVYVIISGRMVLRVTIREILKQNKANNLKGTNEPLVVFVDFLI